MHPLFHPSRRQAQFNAASFDEFAADYDAAALEKSGVLSPFVVTVGPGDVLYVPPFWLHEVQTLDERAVSYSVVSPSKAEYLFGQVLHAPVPFGRIPRGNDRALAGNELFF